MRVAPPKIAAIHSVVDAILVRVLATLFAFKNADAFEATGAWAGRAVSYATGAI